MFTWDGSDITDKIIETEIYEAKYNKHKYWIIVLPESKSICLVRNGKNTLPCLVDELKPMFGLNKIGTHWCVINNQIKILSKVILTPDGHVQEEEYLTDNREEIKNNLFRIQMQNIYTFRELLGVTCSYDTSIVLRRNNMGVYPVSYYEPNMIAEDKKVIPFSILDKWFGEISIDDVVKRLMKINTIDRLMETLYHFRTKIEEVINRVDKRNITYKSYIIDRITQRLQSSLI